MEASSPCVMCLRMSDYLFAAYYCVTNNDSLERSHSKSPRSLFVLSRYQSVCGTVTLYWSRLTTYM